MTSFLASPVMTGGLWEKGGGKDFKKGPEVKLFMAPNVRSKRPYQSFQNIIPGS
jgi:hypothetical protein